MMQSLLAFAEDSWQLAKREIWSWQWKIIVIYGHWVVIDCHWLYSQKL